MKRKLCIIWILALTMICMSQALCEQTVWDCPECGKNGNTRSFCGRCGHPAPWMSELPDTDNSLPSVAKCAGTIRELSNQADTLIQLASAWTEQTFPQTLDSLPGFPKIVVDLAKNAMEQVPVLEKKENQYILRFPYEVEKWFEYLPDDFSKEHSMSCDYSNGESTVGSFELTQEAADAYSFTLPSQVELSDILDFNLYSAGRKTGMERWEPHLLFVYNAIGENKTECWLISLLLEDYYREYNLCVDCGYAWPEENEPICKEVAVEISTKDGNGWMIELIYDMESGQLKKWECFGR